MIEEIGVVVSVHGEMAEVEGQRRSTCGGCAINGACGTSLVARYFGRKPLRFRTRNSIDATPGDRVVLGVPEGALLQASFIAYMVPLVALIGGAALGDHAAVLWAPDYARGMSVFGGLGALAVALLWLGRVSRAKASDHRYHPKILRRAGQGAQAVAYAALELPGKHHIGGA